MKITPLAIPDILLIEPKVFGDERGYFFESFRQDAFEKATGFPVNFIQDNESRSTQGVLRGLHFQTPPYAQSKLVRVIEGEVLDIAVDIRRNSPTFGQHVSALLSAENKHQLFIPRGFAHGFAVLSSEAIFSYKVDNYYAPDNDAGIHYQDPELDIDWQLAQEDIKTSAKDQTLPTLKSLLDSSTKWPFEYGNSLYD